MAIDIQSLKYRLGDLRRNVSDSVASTGGHQRLILIGGAVAAVLVIVLLAIWVPRLLGGGGAGAARPQVAEADIEKALPEVATLRQTLSADPRFENLTVTPSFNAKDPESSTLMIRGSVPDQAAMADLQRIVEETAPDLRALWFVSPNG